MKYKLKTNLRKGPFEVVPSAIFACANSVMTLCTRAGDWVASKAVNFALFHVNASLLQLSLFQDLIYINIIRKFLSSGR